MKFISESRRAHTLNWTLPFSSKYTKRLDYKMYACTRGL